MRKKTRKQWFALLAAALLAAVLAACDGGVVTSSDGPTQVNGTYVGPGASSAPSGGEEPAQEDAAITFTDALGRTVTVGRPRRVAALIGSFADIWCLAGGEETLVAAADDTWTQFELALLAAEPEFILASAGTSADVELLPLLEQTGIPTAYFDVSTFDDYLTMLELCTRITGCPERYERYGAEVRTQVDEALARAEGREGTTVLYLRASAGGCKVKNSEGSVLGEMLAALGCVNIADSDASLLEELSLEAILAAPPDQILIVLQSNHTEKERAALEE